MFVTATTTSHWFHLARAAESQFTAGITATMSMGLPFPLCLNTHHNHFVL